jgi:hypothetical protein
MNMNTTAIASVELNLAEHDLTNISPEIENPSTFTEISEKGMPKAPTGPSVYRSHCYACFQHGVDSSHPECIHDPPYAYTCMFCGKSLRSHPTMGEGKSKDLANKHKMSLLLKIY